MPKKKEELTIEDIRRKTRERVKRFRERQRKKETREK